MLWGGRWEGGSYLGTHVHPWWIHVNVWQNQYSTVKQNKVKIKIKKKSLQAIINSAAMNIGVHVSLSILVSSVCMIWENGIETCIISCKKRIASLCLMQDTGCLGLVHGDDPERCYGAGGGRGVHIWERMYTRGGFMSMYGKTNTVL